MIVSIICEYNPLHLGHIRQFEAIREKFGPDTTIVCLMSGNFVQRGQPAVIDKSLRAKAAIKSCADLILELPITAALSSAEGFASAGVRILSPFSDYLCFGTESGTEESLMRTAKALLSPAFSVYLKEALEKGLSFPSAREQALQKMGFSDALVRNPNDILAVEYCKAILAEKSSMRPFPIRRQGSYHAEDADPENPSATAVRSLMLSSGLWLDSVPESARSIFADASIHTIAAGERAMLMRLRTMTDEAFEALPYGSEGLWRKFMHCARERSSLEGILASTKSKRYTRSRIDRMAMCAFLGLTAQDLEMRPPYTRILAFNDRGRRILNAYAECGHLKNIGEKAEHPYWVIEQRAQDLYGLFCTDAPEAPGREEKRRVYYHKNQD